MININELNKRISVKSVDKKTGTREEIWDCWASIRNTTGSEIKRNGLEIDSVKTRFVIRFTRIPLKNNMKIYYSGKVFNIVYVNNYNESNEFLEILATYTGETYEG